MANQTASSQIFALVDTRTPIGTPSAVTTFYGALSAITAS